MRGDLCVPELLADAEECPRLSDWEERFVEDLQRELEMNGKLDLTPKQEAVLRRIEAKVYAT